MTAPRPAPAAEPGSRTAGGLGWPLADGVPSGGLGWPAETAAAEAGAPSGAGLGEEGTA